MNQQMNNGDGFIGYEYKEIRTTHDMEGVYADGYPNFGWTLDGHTASILGSSVVSLKFKRDRKIRNKAELSRLQRQFEQGVEEILDLERSKATKAFIAALVVGLIGSAFLAGATFSFIYLEMIPLMVILAVPGFVGWILPYFLYKRMISKRSAKVVPLIEQQYDSIYEVCEKAHGLLA